MKEVLIRLKDYIDRASKDTNAKILAGGNTDKTKGYFIQPTVIETTDPNYVTLKEEILDRSNYICLR